MSKVKCPACWNEIEQNAERCPVCGFVLRVPTSENNADYHANPTYETLQTPHFSQNVIHGNSTSTSRKNTSKNKKIILIVVVIFFLILVISIGKRTARNNRQDYNTASSYSYTNDPADNSGNYTGYTSSNSTATTGNDGAVNKAISYLNSSAFSYTGLIEQLEYEGFSESEATYGADHCGADWDEQALLKARSYLNSSAFSESGLVEQLEYEGFTSDQASYGVENCGANWNEQAAKKAASYLNMQSFSRSDLIEQLEYEGFTYEQASYGASQNGL